MKLNSIKAITTSATLAILASAAHAGTLVEQVKEATARFADVNVAIAEGYGPIPCASAATGGGMGVHFVNGGYLMEDDNALDIAKPEAVMYEPQADGSFVFVGVEYITFAGPAALQGHLFRLHGSPNRYGLDAFYELHVWTGRENPRGTFATNNPNVSCEHAG
jgi:hypothetical protein